MVKFPVSSWKKLPKTIWVLAWVSLFQNSSSIISSSLSNALIIDVLGGTVKDVGVIRGLTEGLAYIVKLFSGFFSDYLGKRKPIILIGYACAAITKPFFAAATSIYTYAFAQTLDRIANGLRDTPRDAMVADVAPKDMKGECFGVRQAFSQVGSAIGALLGFFLLSKIAGSGFEIRIMYMIAAIPTFLAVAILYFYLDESKNLQKLKNRKGFPIKKEDLKQLGWRFWYLMFVIVIFMCARVSESLLISKAYYIGIEVKYHTLVLFVLYFFNAPMSNIAGVLSDKMGRKMFWLLGVIGLFIANLMLAFSESYLFVFIAIAIWGMHFGATQVVMYAFVADYAPPHIKGTSFGIFNIINAIGIITASVTVGSLAKNYSMQTAFLTMAIISCIAIVALLFLPEPKKQ